MEFVLAVLVRKNQGLTRAGKMKPVLLPGALPFAVIHPVS